MKAPSLTIQIFIGLVVGVFVGAMFPQIGIALHPGADIFLRLIKTIIAPLVFATLVVGIAGMESAHSLGRLSFKCFLYFEVVTTFALGIGLLLVNIIKPGAGMQIQTTQNFGELAAKQPQAADLITHIFPTSIIDSMARGDVLQIVVFSILFAMAVSATKSENILVMCQSLADVMFKYTGYIMKFAPIGVACAMAATVGEHGLTVLVSLGKLIGTLYLALVVFVVFILGPIAFFAKIPLKKFFGAVKEPFLIAFSTTSSEAALPKALIAMESIGVPRKIVSFVLPLGYTFNLDGTTLYLSLASVFVAQAAGVNLSIQQQLLMMLTLMLTSKGVAAVPRASLVILAGTLSSFGLPLAGVALILGADTIMDMARTSVNVLGNCLASCVVARWEGEFDDAKANAAHPEPHHGQVAAEAVVAPAAEDAALLAEGELTGGTTGEEAESRALNLK
ncbi:MAG: cation:dicarboxylase symporter family transporter [Leptolyngbya sp.]|nr:cation:dicarboxylase symporter family transporter [Candidatus Melainabacteria bacterium]